jgi:hypothetical protein
MHVFNASQSCPYSQGLESVHGTPLQGQLTSQLVVTQCPVVRWHKQQRVELKGAAISNSIAVPEIDCM